MKRRREAGPIIDFVDALFIGRQVRIADYQVAASGWSKVDLGGLASEYGFETVEAMRLEAEQVRETWRAARDEV